MGFYLSISNRLRIQRLFYKQLCDKPTKTLIYLLMLSLQKCRNTITPKPLDQASFCHHQVCASPFFQQTKAHTYLAQYCDVLDI